jgi:serine/threonine protein kinase/Tol biopolymer transport system component
MKSGSALGSYQVLSPLGAGGMGEVYRAHDPKLDREVAIKVLPEETSADPERIARFQREARTLAALQHPNIGSIYGFEEDGENRFLVMELVDGPDLSERLKAGPIPINETVALSMQLLDGLQAAHDQGIIHRDLKPANIKITPDGNLKILDFGLARAYTGDPESNTALLSSPTITAAMTQAGVILGTAAYMAPEQARGEAVDQRADLWAFGVILFEMLTGKRFFAGDTVSDTLAAVLRAELDWDLLPDDTPANVRRVLRRCLARHPKERLRSAADARLELEDDEHSDSLAPKAQRSLALPIAMGVLAAAVLVAVWIFRPGGEDATDPAPTHLSLALPDGLQVASRDQLPLGAPQPSLAISEDGRLIVATVERDGATWLYRRFLDRPEGEILEETRGSYHPAISPDGEWISYMQGNALMKMSARGDRATRLVELPNAFGHTWVSNDEIIINRNEAQILLRVDTERGDVEPYDVEAHLHQFFWPSRVPGRDAILYNSRSHVAKSSESDLDQISIIDLQTNEQTVVGIGGSMPRLLSGGPLLLVRDGQVMAAPFDINLPGRAVKPTTALEGVLIEGWIGQYAVSEEGTVVYVAGDWLFGNELVWDGGRDGVESLGFPVLGYGDFELAPDSSRLAIAVGGGADSQIWIYDLERGSRRLLTTDDRGALATWSPDGEKVAYGSVTGGPWRLLVRTVGSTEPPTLLYEADRQIGAYAWHEEVGILFNIGSAIYRVNPDEVGEPEVVVDTDASEWGPDISPDGRWLAYTSDESGRYEIYARSLAGDRSYNVSLDGGEEPIFSDDGKTIYYRNGNRFYATPILEASADGSRFRAGRPEVVVEGPYSNVPGLSYDVDPDGKLLLLRSDGGTERPDHLNVILDWRVDVDE